MRGSPIAAVWSATAIMFVGWMSIAAPATAQTPSARTVLTIHSGSEFFPSNPILDAAIRDVLLTANAVRIDYYAEYLESVVRNPQAEDDQRLQDLDAFLPILFGSGVAMTLALALVVGASKMHK